MCDHWGRGWRQELWSPELGQLGGWKCHSPRWVMKDGTQGLMEGSCCDSSGPENDDERARRELAVIHVNHLTRADRHILKENWDLQSCLIPHVQIESLNSILFCLVSMPEEGIAKIQMSPNWGYLIARYWVFRWWESNKSEKTIPRKATFFLYPAHQQLIKHQYDYQEIYTLCKK